MNIVVAISWIDKGESREQFYGPFKAQEDNSHLAEIQEFAGRWIAVNGQPSNVMLYLVKPPEAVTE